MVSRSIIPGIDRENYRTFETKQVLSVHLPYVFFLVVLPTDESGPIGRRQVCSSPELYIQVLLPLANTEIMKTVTRAWLAWNKPKYLYNALVNIQKNMGNHHV